MRLLAICYPDEILAGRAAEELERCAEETGIEPDAASTVVCRRDGSQTLTANRSAGARTQWCRFWGALLATLPEGGESVSVDSRFRASLQARLLPGTSVLLLAASRSALRRALDALSPYGGRVLWGDIGDDPSLSGEDEITRSG